MKASVVKILCGVSALSLGAASPANAWLPHGTPTTPTAPVLQAVSVPFGLNTPIGRGGVQSSVQDFTTTSVHPVTYSGFGLMSPTAPACAFWYWSWVSNSSSRPSTDWTLPAQGVAEGALAITPVPASTSIAGTTIFNVYCKDASLNQSNTVSVTYTPDANTATVGTADSLSSGFTPGTWGNIAGQRITAAVGMVRTNFFPSVPHYTNQVTITPADTARRPYVIQLGVTGANPGNVLVTDWVLSGSITTVPTNLVAGVTVTAANAISDVVFDTIKFYGSEAMNGTGNNGANGAIGWIFNNGSSCASNCVFQNSEFNYVESGVSPRTNTAVRNVTFRYVYNNCIFITNQSNFELSDVKCLAPMQRYKGAHPDMIQIADEAVPGPGILIQRFLAHQADGDYFAQGPIFSNSNPIPGYVDDGTAGHGPGNIFTKTGSSFSANEGGTLIVIPGFVQSSAGVTMSCNLGASCAASTQVTLVGLAATNIGSSASPVNLWGPQINNLQMSGIMSSQAGPYGTSLGGNAGTSYIYDYDYVTMNTQNPAIGSFTGSVTSGVLTATTTAVSNIPGQTAWIYGSTGNMGRLNYSGCAYLSNCVINSKTSGADEGPGTFTTGGPDVALGTIQISGAYPGQSVPAFEPFNCSSADVWGGTFNVDRGFYQSGYFPRYGCTVGTDFPASGMTIGSHAFGPTASGYTPSGGTLTAADYASGMLPSAYLAAHAFTASDTPDDILRINCLANKGKIGGKKDGGSGVWYGSVTGETNSVTHTGGGDWIVYNGSSHVISTHITGCENAP